MNVIKGLARLLRPALENALILRVRRNHGLEHATIHILNRQRYVLSGRASAGGFLVYGDVPTEKLERAAHEALQRMKSGQSYLALHPNCGTNLVTTGLLLTGVGALGFVGTNRRAAWGRFPIVMLLMMATSFYSLPIGMSVQKHITTSGEPGEEMQVVAVKRRAMPLPLRDKPLVVHEVITRGG